MHRVQKDYLFKMIVISIVLIFIKGGPYFIPEIVLYYGYKILEFQAYLNEKYGRK